MKKLTSIKDYLHLHMGCNFITDNSQGNINPTTYAGILKYFDQYTGFKLCLREINNITIAELYDYLSIRRPDYRIVDIAKSEDNRFFDYQLHSGKRLQPAKREFFYTIAQCITAVPYLLSRKLNVFDLPEEWVQYYVHDSQGKIQFVAAGQVFEYDPKVAEAQESFENGQR